MNQTLKFQKTFLLTALEEWVSQFSQDTKKQAIKLKELEDQMKKDMAQNNL